MNNQGKKPKILIIDDMAVNIRMLIEILKDEYATIPVKSGEAALRKAQIHPLPDLILLDIIMPDMDGYEVCRRLKEDEHTRDIPVIFISAMSEAMDNAKAFELGAVDYVSKPFNPVSVRARVRTHIKLRRAMLELERLYKTALDSNPMTRLPGNNSITAEIKKALANNDETCIIYADLDNFKAFNDKYGFACGDEVILFTSSILKEATLSVGSSDAFIGHVGGDDFVLLVPSEKCEKIVHYIITQFDQRILGFYNEEDTEKKYITAVDRRGATQKFPMMSISIGGINLSTRRYNHYLQINDAIAEVKKMAKGIQGSSFFMDRRKNV